MTFFCQKWRPDPRNVIIDKAVDLPSLSVYTFSPYNLVVKISDEGISRLPEVMHEYIQAYIKLWQEAEQVAEKTSKVFDLVF